MSDPYAPKRRRVTIKARQWKTGVVTLKRTVREDSDSETPWIPGDVSTEQTYVLDAVVKGVASDYVDGATVLASDLMVVMSPKAVSYEEYPEDEISVSDIEPVMSDKLLIDGRQKTIKRIQPVPAAGTPAMYHIFIAS